MTFGTAPFALPRGRVPPTGFRRSLVVAAAEIYSKFQLYSDRNSRYREFYSKFHIDFGLLTSTRSNRYEKSAIIRQKLWNPQILFDFSYTFQTNTATCAPLPAPAPFPTPRKSRLLTNSLYSRSDTTSANARPTAGSIRATHPHRYRQLYSCRRSLSLECAYRTILAMPHGPDHPARDRG